LDCSAVYLKRNWRSSKDIKRISSVAEGDGETFVRVNSRVPAIAIYAPASMSVVDNVSRRRRFQPNISGFIPYVHGITIRRDSPAFAWRAGILVEITTRSQTYRLGSRA